VLERPPPSRDTRERAWGVADDRLPDQLPATRTIARLLTCRIRREVDRIHGCVSRSEILSRYLSTPSPVRCLPGHENSIP